MPQNTYTRQSSFSNGDVADATQINAEFDQLVEVFDKDSGHTHDGTTGQGSYVPLISDLSNVTKVETDVIDPSNHKITFTVDGVVVASFSETDGFQVSNANIKIEELSNVSTPVASGFFRWDALGENVIYVETVDAEDLTGFSTVATTGDYNDLLNLPVISTVGSTGEYADLLNAPALDSVNFTHNGVNMQVFLDDLDVRVGDAEQDVIDAAQSADEAAASAVAAQNAAMSVGVPTIIADAGSYVIPDTTEIADVVFEGEGTLTLPTILVKGRRFKARVSSKAVETKLLTITNPSFSIVGNKLTLVAGDNLTVAPGQLVVLEAISTTELEII